MRIERVEPILVNIPYTYGTAGAKHALKMNVLFVRIDTDEGITGWGEAFGFNVSPVTREAVETLLAPRCIGREIGDPAAFTANLAYQFKSAGRTGPIAFGVSGIDIALWDIVGQAAGKPIHQLLGNKQRERLPAYASLLGFHNVEEAARNAAAAVEDGYRHIKLHETDTPSVAAARAAIGGDIPLMVDVNCAWTPDEGLRMAREWEAYDLRWLEEPVWPPEDHAAMKRIRTETRVPVASGENAHSALGLIALAQDGIVDVVQPSVTKFGGISALRPVIAAAEAANVEVALHSPYLGPGLVATIHLIAAMERDVVVERFYLDFEASPMGAWTEVTNGSVPVPSAPGLGVVPDAAILERYRIA
jgi:L-alanine-DL-glutamate epimerase-like enolase superfamily enzyme